jgi:hypothetical protein
MTLSITTLSKSIVCHYAECRIFFCYAEPNCAECRNAECRYAECRHVTCCSAFRVPLTLKSDIESGNKI